MVMLILCAIFAMFMTLDVNENENRFFLIATCVLFTISTFITFSFNEFKFKTENRITEFTEEIHSLRGDDISVYGQFFLGSGTIGSNSQYSYFIKNPDGSKEKKYIETMGTKIYEDNSKKPYIQITKCKLGKEYNFVAGLHVETEDKSCQSKTTKIFVPENTVILEFNVK